MQPIKLGKASSTLDEPEHPPDPPDPSAILMSGVGTVVFDGIVIAGHCDDTSSDEGSPKDKRKCVASRVAADVSVFDGIVTAGHCEDTSGDEDSRIGEAEAPAAGIRLPRGWHRSDDSSSDEDSPRASSAGDAPVADPAAGERLPHGWQWPKWCMERKRPRIEVWVEGECVSLWTEGVPQTIVVDGNQNHAFLCVEYEWDGDKYVQDFGPEHVRRRGETDTVYDIFARGDSMKDLAYKISDLGTSIEETKGGIDALDDELRALGEGIVALDEAVAVATGSSAAEGKFSEQV